MLLVIDVTPLTPCYTQIELAVYASRVNYAVKNDLSLTAWTQLTRDAADCVFILAGRFFIQKLFIRGSKAT